jgi:preprotein translocase subunit SecG
MIKIIIIIHLMIAIGLVTSILLQRSEGGGLGIGGGGGGGGGLMTGRSSANLLTRMTGIMAALFFATSLVLAILSAGTTERASILDQGAPAAGQTTPAKPSEPSVPLAQ